MELLYIHWNPDPALFHLGGFTLRWYSVLWMIAILTGSQVVYHCTSKRDFRWILSKRCLPIVLSVSLPGHA